MNKKVVMWRDQHDEEVVHLGTRIVWGDKGFTFQSLGTISGDYLSDLFGEHDWECLGTCPMEVDLSVYLNDEDHE